MTFAIYTLGCKVNTYESEYLIDLFKKNGYTEVSFDDKADIYIINTCSVTNQADNKSKKMIRHAIRMNKDACIIAMGCFTENDKDYYEEGLSIKLGTSGKTKLLDYIDEWNKEKKYMDKSISIDKEFESMEISNFLGRTRAFIKIQDGCENYCTYCIIPYVRGKCRSKRIIDVVEEVTRVVKNGYKEVVLTGIHTGSFGIDNNESFAKLLDLLCDINGLKRLRISSIEVTELNEDVLNVIRDNNVIVDHLHIPLQAGSNKILKLMNRKYDLDSYKNKIDEIRSIRPNISISTDVIVGFPGEEESDFVNTLNFCKEINYSKIHVFPYSKRNGTPSVKFSGHVNDVEKKNRVKRLIDLSHELEVNYMNSFINKTCEVLVEVCEDGYSIGHTSNYLLVKFKGNYSSGDLVNVLLKEVDYPYIEGEINE